MQHRLQILGGIGTYLKLQEVKCKNIETSNDISAKNPKNILYRKGEKEKDCLHLIVTTNYLKSLNKNLIELKRDVIFNFLVK